MTSSRKTEANRANARQSTGPRTASGRSRASLNALKHGLTVPASVDPALQSDIDHLARQLAGTAQDDPVVMVRALKVAEAAVELQRARRARLDLLRAWDLSTGAPQRIVPVEPAPDFKSIIKNFRELAQEATSEESRRRLKLLQSAATRLDRVARIFNAWAKADPSAPIASWSDLIRQLERLDRYERRARSRRDRAIKEFDTMKTKAMSI